MVNVLSEALGECSPSALQVGLRRRYGDSKHVGGLFDGEIVDVDESEQARLPSR